MKSISAFILVFAAASVFAADPDNKAKLPTKIVSTEVLQAPPQAKYLPDPAYPEELKKRGIYGTARVQFTITPKGETTEIKVLEASLPAFGVAAREAVIRARFTPAVSKKGEPVAVRIEVPFMFNPNRA